MNITPQSEATREAVRQRYAACRDLTLERTERDKDAASPDTIAADRVADPIEGVART